MSEVLPGGISLDHTGEHIRIEFDTPRRVLSSAVLNGGAVRASHLLNLKVNGDSRAIEPPEKTLAAYCVDAGWRGTTVGMMTATSMDSLRVAKESADGIEIAVLATSGLSNPRRAGDRAECRRMVMESEPVGTINIIAITSAILTDAAMVEALMIVTEAKSAVLQEADVRSPVSSGIATGTGTDAIAVVSGHGPQEVRYCGKHVLFGEILGRLAASAVRLSINYKASAD
ncbi:MAG: adenosylcobinamide amidohydrolase [Pontiella sp.]